MKITKIEPQKRKTRRKRKKYSIWIDEEYAFSCSQEVLLRLGLQEGQEVSASQLKVFLSEIQKKEATDYSLNLLARRPLSEAELRNKLRSRGYEFAIISSTLSHFRDIGLIDDLNYSILWVRNRSKTNPRGTLLLRKELRMKGIAPEIIEKALEEFKNSYDESELLAQVAERRAKKMVKLDPISKKRRLFNYLLRRGFPLDEVRRVIKKY